MGSLINFMRINRWQNFRKVIPSMDNGGTVIVPPKIPTVNPLIYTASDFGDNVINNHYSQHGGHSETCQAIFNYITRNYRERCTSYQSYNTQLLGTNLIGSTTLLEEAKDVKANMIFTPYVNAASWMNAQYNDFVLPVGSHFDNDSTDGIIGNGDRHDIAGLSNGQVLSESVAVSARRDTPETFMEATSYGKGMEFFVDCSPEGLDEYYPDIDMPSAFAALLTEDGITLTSIENPGYGPFLEVGKEITIRYTGDPSTWQITTITDILDNDTIKVSPAITPITTPSIYGWHDVTLGGSLYGQAQSWAVPIVAAQLKVIQLETGATWDEVRQAARATAKRNLTGIPAIDNTNWDEYRGFGQIQVNQAINYLNSPR